MQILQIMKTCMKLTTIRFLFIRFFAGYVGKYTSQETSNLAST